MSTIYTPSPVALINLILPSDGDLRNVASVNGSFKRLADAIANFVAHPTELQLIDIVGTAAHGSSVVGAFLPPADCVAAIVSGCGAGGPGASGGRNGANLVSGSTGGSGGGGALERTSVIPITGGSLHNYVIAAPGAPGVAFGGDTTITIGVTELYRARGAQSGYAGFAGDYAEYHKNGAGVEAVRSVYSWVPGGATPYVAAGLAGIQASNGSSGLMLPPNESYGGLGVNAAARFNYSSAICTGGASRSGYAGGTGGNFGNYSGTFPNVLTAGGGAGGGGGAGPYGAGANGGDGTAAVASGPPLQGGNGSDAGAGSGAGGGGGGGTGTSADIAVNPGDVAGGVGGWGGSGHLRIWLLRLAP